MTQLYFRAFRTRGVYANIPAFRREFARTFQTKVGPGLAAANAKQVAHWKVAPGFAIKHDTSAAGISVFVYPKGPAAKVWYWHVKGVKGRTIRPKRHRQPKYRFRTKGRSPRTKGRGRRPTRAALRFRGRSGEILFRNKVFWKGIRPKPYPQNAANEYTPTFYRLMENTARRAVRAAQREGS